MTEPMTEAGRTLLAMEPYNSRAFALITPDAIAAIEREAIDAYLASPEAVAVVRKAITDAYYETRNEGGTMEQAADRAAAAALRDLRGAK